MSVTSKNGRGPRQDHALADEAREGEGERERETDRQRERERDGSTELTRSLGDMSLRAYTLQPLFMLTRMRAALMPAGVDPPLRPGEREREKPNPGERKRERERHPNVINRGGGGNLS